MIEITASSGSSVYHNMKTMSTNNTVRYLEQGKLKTSAASSSKKSHRYCPALPQLPAFTMEGNANFQFEVSKTKHAIFSYPSP